MTAPVVASVAAPVVARAAALGVPPVVLPGALTADTVPALQADLCAAVEAAVRSCGGGAAAVAEVPLCGGDVVLDAGGVQQFDSAALALLLSLRRHARARGVALTVQHWPPGLRELARVYGVLALLEAGAEVAAGDEPLAVHADVPSPR